MAQSVPIDTREITITPVFRWASVENVPQSELQGHLVKRMIQVVEVRFAGSRNYSPVFPVDAFWKRENGKVITYAERWGEQYRAFLEGNAQEAMGTPLEMLRSYGISESQLSLCRSLKIYSIEALYHLEGDALKNLQMAGNALKDMARKYMADRTSNTANGDRIAELEAEIARMKLAQPGPTPQTTQVLVPDPKPADVDKAVAISDAEMSGLTDEQLKAKIKEVTGSAPRGTPSRTFLENAVRELAG